jgi:hypothetical protein
VKPTYEELERDHAELLDFVQTRREEDRFWNNLTRTLTTPLTPAMLAEWSRKSRQQKAAVDESPAPV